MGLERSPVPTLSFPTDSFFSPTFVSPGCIPIGGLPWLLAEHRDLICPPWLLRGWRGEGSTGRKAWPAPVLMALVLLRWSENLPRETAIRRASTDLGWRAAMRLPADVKVPSDRTVRDFERFLAERHPDIGVRRYVLFHEHIVRLCVGHGILGKAPLWGIDSTPMWCFGACIDTVRLMGTGLRHLARWWAKATGERFADVARAWSAPFLLAPSTKGGFDIDWKDREQRAKVVDTLARLIVRVVDDIRRRVADIRRRFRKRALALCRGLAGIVANDLELGEKGRLVIARKVTEGRLVSFTDRQARNGVKSKSKRFKGFKLSLIGDLVSGLIASVAVTPGNQHDQDAVLPLVSRATALVDDIDELLGDSAYGFAEKRERVRRQYGVTLISPPSNSAPPTIGDRFSKRDFAIDFDTDTATCPADIQSADKVRRKIGERQVPTYVWPRESCDACPLRERCLTGRSRSKRLLLHPHERALRESREQWEQAATKRKYRRRGEFERLVGRMTQLGGRRAKAWGIAFARLQAHCLAAINNLGLLAARLAQGGTANV